MIDPSDVAVLHCTYKSYVLRSTATSAIDSPRAFPAFLSYQRYFSSLPTSSRYQVPPASSVTTSRSSAGPDLSSFYQSLSLPVSITPITLPSLSQRLRQPLITSKELNRVHRRPGRAHQEVACNTRHSSSWFIPPHITQSFPFLAGTDFIAWHSQTINLIDLGIGMSVTFLCSVSFSLK